MLYTDCKRQLWHVNTIIKRLQAKSSAAMTEQLKKDASALLEIWKADLQRQLDSLDTLHPIGRELINASASTLMLNEREPTTPIVANADMLALLDDPSALGVLNTQHLAYVYIKVRDPSLPSLILRIYYIERGVLYSGGIVSSEHLRPPSDTQLHHAKLLAKPVTEIPMQTNTPAAAVAAPAARKFMGQKC